MRRILALIATVSLFATTVSAQNDQARSRVETSTRVETRSRVETRTRVETGDLLRFVRALETAGPRDAEARLASEYLGKASPGLAAFAPDRISDARTLLARAAATKAYHAHLRKLTPEFERAGTALAAAAEKFRALFPALPAAEIDIVMGGLTDWGARSTASDGSFILAIAADFFGRTPDAPLAELVPDIAQKLRPPGDLPAFGIRALALSAQADSDRGAGLTNAPGLLEFALIEGQAEFFAEHLTGRLPDAARFAELAPLEPIHWEAFVAAADGTDFTGWARTGRRTSRPPSAADALDLARLYGYRLAAAFFAGAVDKSSAATSLIMLRDARAVLSQANYDPELLRLK